MYGTWIEDLQIDLNKGNQKKKKKMLLKIKPDRTCTFKNGTKNPTHSKLDYIHKGNPLYGISSGFGFGRFILE